MSSVLRASTRPNATSAASRSSCGLSAALALLVWCLLAPSARARITWDPVAPADLAATDSKAAPGTDLEFLFSRHEIYNNGRRTYSSNYIRAKIYTAKAVGMTNVLSIEEVLGGETTEVAARVVKQDGRSIDVDKKDIHETSVVKVHDYEQKKTTFAFPDLQPGDIVEYRWKQTVPEYWWSYHRIYCQAEDAFTREFTFSIGEITQDFQLIWANCKPDLVDQKTHKVVLKNIPPFVREPHLMAESEFRGWVMLILTDPRFRRGRGKQATDWSSIAVDVGESFDDDTEPTKKVKAQTAKLVTSAGTHEEMLERIYRFCQVDIDNLDDANNAKLAAAKAKRDKEEEEQSPDDTLQRRSGTPWDVTVLFASMMRAAGFDVRLAMSGSTNEVMDIRTPKGWVTANRREVAVKLDGKWKLFTPGDPLVPCGLLRITDEGAIAYLCGPKDFVWDHAQVALPVDSQIKRTGHFALSDDGSLDGDVDIELTGHPAIDARATYRSKNDEESLKTYRDALAERLPTIELTKFSITNVDDNTKPVVIHYQAHVPGYAESVGSRLLFPLNYFTANAPATFSSDTRKLPIFFENTESFHDHVELTIPEGMRLDGASAPQSVGASEQPFFAKYETSYLPKTRTISYRRDFLFGNGGMLAFQAASYGALRQVLDRIHTSDTHQLAVKPVTAPASSSAAQPAASVATPTASATP